MIKYWKDPLDLALDLTQFQWPLQMEFDAIYPLDDIMLNNSRQVGSPNPF